MGGEGCGGASVGGAGVGVGCGESGGGDDGCGLGSWVLMGGLYKKGWGGTYSDGDSILLKHVRGLCTVPVRSLLGALATDGGLHLLFRRSIGGSFLHHLPSFHRLLQMRGAGVDIVSSSEAVVLDRFGQRPGFFFFGVDRLGVDEELAPVARSFGKDSSECGMALLAPLEDAPLVADVTVVEVGAGALSGGGLAHDDVGSGLTEGVDGVQHGVGHCCLSLGWRGLLFRRSTMQLSAAN